MKKGFEAAQAMSRKASKASLKKWDMDIVELDVHDIAALMTYEGQMIQQSIVSHICCFFH